MARIQLASAPNFVALENRVTILEGLTPGASTLFNNVAAVLADTNLTYTTAQTYTVTTGDYVTTRDGFAYTVAASGATDHDVTTSGGVKLYVVTNTSGEYPVEALNAWTDANAGQNAVIAHANRKGSSSAGTAPLTYIYTAQSYDMRTGSRTALEVSSVTFKGNLPKVQLSESPFVLLGVAGTLADTITIEGFAPDCSSVPVREKGTVTGATQANPVEITCTAHGFSTGEQVRLFDLGGMTELNDRAFTITSTGANTFTLDGEDGTGHTAYTSGGEVRPETDSALVKAVNAARIFIKDIKPARLTHIFKADPPSGSGVSTIEISDCRINGHESYDWVALHTRNADFGAGIYLKEVTGFPTNVPANPTVLPKAVTGATQANPVVITCTGHNFTTGDNIRLSALGGMTELNGRDFTITVINANSFSLDGEDGTGHTAYTSGGSACELHWSKPYDTGVIFINGKWDTARISGGPYMHYAWLWRLRSSGVISFIWEDDARWDYGGEGRIQAVMDGSSISHVHLDGGWHWCLDGNFIDMDNPGSGFITDFIVKDMEVGLCGDSFINDPLNRILNLDVQGCSFDAIGRARTGTSHIFNPGVNARCVIKGNRCPDPDDRYGSGSDAFLSADTGITLLGSQTYDISHNEIRALTTFYSLPTPTSGDVRDRIIKSNRRTDGALPEYFSTSSVAVSSGTTVTNYSGLQLHVYVRSGTITSIAKNGLAVANDTNVSLTLQPGETWSPTYSVTPSIVYSYTD